eukprot:CAMPEP_0114488802 /NCGR_PEP_ID=MMETSP0109-20121206/1528_1 /TAXON_ID=29199 /ORGANISM="Chlorarachnion reptans, Strain CCCM449" /LENGTH=814 /DNA_ID=CAMNT_0001665227 /DNA_START=137 /DNA_END=2581 /DNA_ORIENTATION=+
MRTGGKPGGKDEKQAFPSTTTPASRPGRKRKIPTMHAPSQRRRHRHHHQTQRQGVPDKQALRQLNSEPQDNVLESMLSVMRFVHALHYDKVQLLLPSPRQESNQRPEIADSDTKKKDVATRNSSSSERGCSSTSSDGFGSRKRTQNSNRNSNKECTHGKRINGLCILCGKNVGDLEIDGKPGSGKSLVVNEGRHLQMTADYALKSTELYSNRLRNSEKLALVLDIDHTILQATPDPRIEIFKDYPQLWKDIYQLPNCRTFVKLRPGLMKMLDSLKPFYDISIYTHGTRNYADGVVALLGERRFYNRVCRNDFAPVRVRTKRGANKKIKDKDLGDLLNCDSDLVLILDDKPEVWSGSSRSHVLPALPFIFFKGLPEVYNRETGDFESTAAVEPQKPSDKAGKSSDTRSSVAAKKPSQPEATLFKQTPQVPLFEQKPKAPPFQLKPQVPLFTEKASPKVNNDKKTSKVPIINDTVAPSNVSPDNGGHKRIVADEIPSRNRSAKFESVIAGTDDTKQSSGGLKAKEDPSAVCSTVDAQVAQRIKLLIEQTQDIRAQLRGRSAADILRHVRSSVLAGCVIVFSGVIDRKKKPWENTMWRLASQFGAICYEKMGTGCIGAGFCSHDAQEHNGKRGTETITHLVCRREGTEKVKKVRKNPHLGIHVVQCEWLQNAASHFVRPDESLFELERIRLPNSSVYHASKPCTVENLLQGLVNNPAPVPAVDHSRGSRMQKPPIDEKQRTSSWENEQPSRIEIRKRDRKKRRERRPKKGPMNSDFEQMSSYLAKSFLGGMAEGVDKMEDLFDAENDPGDERDSEDD